MHSHEAALTNTNQIHELNPEGSQTVLLLGGITEGIATQEPFAEALAHEGFRTLSFDYVTEPKTPDYHPRPYYAAKVDQVDEILKSQSEKSSLFAHSYGASIALTAALRNPDKVERIILANPEGLFDDTFPRLAGRFALESVRKSVTMKKTAQRQQLEGVKHAASHLGEFIGDAKAIAASDIREKLARLQAAGIKVDILLSAKDKVFPWKLQEEYFVGQDPEQFDFNSVSSYFNTKENGRQHKLASKWAGHDQNIVYPQQTAQLVKQLLNN